MQKLVDNALWILSLLFIIPTIFIMASWNSYPGEPMYGVKLALEKTLLFFVKPSYAAEASLNVVYTERRFSEAKTLLANDQSAKGLSYLSQQITSTTAVIDRAPNQETKKKIATEYVAKLKEVNSTLEEQKQIVISKTPSSFASPVPTKVIPTTKPMTGVIAATPTTKPAAIVIAATPTTKPVTGVIAVTPTTKPVTTAIAATPTTKPVTGVIAIKPTVIPMNDSFNLNSQGSLQLKSAQITQTQQIIQQNIDELETILKEPDKKKDKKEDKKNEVNQNNDDDTNNRDGGNDRSNAADGRD